MYYNKLEVNGVADNICDVIIPVYNAYEYLKECINSIADNTKKCDYRLILINDKSTDIRIQKYFENLKKKKTDKIILLDNKKNLGFVKTVNKGMAYSHNDVILLNSDTVVTNRWIEKIREAAYTNKAIATVTPLTNNGTICSVPNFLEDNELPSNIELEKYSQMIENLSCNKIIEIPTAVGFCMYIKRSVINEIGLFDDVNFGKGYGEENDFCCRCIENGYINVVCTNTFIYHKGDMSFKEDKAKLTKRNLKVLLKKHPYYNAAIHKFIQNNPLKYIQDSIKLQIEINNSESIMELREYNNEASVTIIMVIKDRNKLLKDCMYLIENTVYKNYKILIIDTESEKIQKSFYIKSCDIKIELVSYKTGYDNSYSYAFNEISRKINSKYILFLDNLTKPIEPNWLSDIITSNKGTESIFRFSNGNAEVIKKYRSNKYNVD